MRRSGTIQKQIDLFMESVKKLKYYKVACLAKGDVQSVYVSGRDKEDALQRVKSKYGGKYEPVKIELV